MPNTDILTWQNDPNFSGAFVVVGDTLNAIFGKNRFQQSLTIQLDGARNIGETQLVFTTQDPGFTQPPSGVFPQAVIDRGGANQEVVLYSAFAPNTPAGKSTLTLKTGTSLIANHNDLEDAEEINKYLQWISGSSIYYNTNTDPVGNVYCKQRLHLIGSPTSNACCLVLRHSTGATTSCYVGIVSNQLIRIYKILNNVISQIGSQILYTPSSDFDMYFRCKNVSSNVELAIDIDSGSGPTEMFIVTDSSSPIQTDGHVGFGNIAPSIGFGNIPSNIDRFERGTTT